MDGPRLVWDVQRVVSRPTAHDAVMRVRTSTGVRPTDFYGHFFMSNTTDVELAAIGKAVLNLIIKHAPTIKQLTDDYIPPKHFCNCKLEEF